MNLRWFHALADRLTSPVLLLTPEGMVAACNPPARRFLPKIAVEDDLAARVHDTARFRHYLALAARTASTIPGSASFDGGQTQWRCDAALAVIADERWLTLQLRPMNETVRRFIALNEHIDRLNAEIRRRESLEMEREHLLAREREARAAAEDASRFKDELLASISHELRTPLNAIQGWLAILKRSPNDQEVLARAIEVIERNVAAEVQLTEDLVDASLAITGRMKMQLEMVDLEPVIRQAVDTALPAAQAKQVRIEVVADVGVCIVHGDPARLLQVIWNLLSNATRHTKKGGRIQVVLRRVSSHVEIAVSDTGEGIVPELLPYIFDRFRRADGSRTRRHGGLGLGLAIVRHLVELHGGFVIAESDGAGKGTTFTVNLPLPIFKPRVAAVEARRQPEESTPGLLSGLRVLLVEDHEDSRELLRMILEQEGARVTVADGSHAARSAFRLDRVDVVISDIEMPEEDGFTLMRKLRDIEVELERPSIPAIALSAHAIGDARLHALRAGYHAFLAKPIMADELVAMLVNIARARPSA